MMKERKTGKMSQQDETHGNCESDIEPSVLELDNWMGMTGTEVASTHN